MSRLAAVEKGEYYPTPLSIVEQIASYLAPAQGRGVIRLLDPCCGEGLALEHLAALLRKHGAQVQTWGVEISPDRAAEAAGRLDLVIEAPFETVTWNHVREGVASLVFLNPPYDYSNKYGRMEYEFLTMAMPALVAGGVLVFIIPTTAVSWGMAEYLYRHFQDIRVFRFGDEEGPAGFDAFNQIVILATRRRESLRTLYEEGAAQATGEFYETYSDSYTYRRGPVKDRVPTALPEGTVYALPSAPRDARMRRSRYTDAEMADLAARVQAQVEEEMAGRLLASQAELPQPLMPPKVGHIAQIVAAGLTGVIETAGRVFKGRVVKVTEVHPDPEDDRKEIALDRYETHVVEVSPAGLTHLSRPSDVADFLQRHADVFRRYITGHFRPYGNSTGPVEDRILDTLSMDSLLPGAARRGLLPFQRECAVALTRAVRRYGVGHLVAEMGFGKTRTALAAVELLGAYPALVVCPPHLVDKWAREVRAAVPGAEAHIIERIGELEALRAPYTPGQKLVVIISRSNIKLGPGWKPCAATRKWLSKDTGTLFLFQERVKAYRAARDRLLAARREGADDATVAALREEAVQARRAALERVSTVPVCPECGEPLSREARESSRPAYCQGRIASWSIEDAEMKEHPCHAALYRFEGYRRWPLADYIRRKMRGFFRVFIADEVHEYKAKDSDQGWAFGLLAGCIPQVITLTGTFFGGPSSSIFWLLHRTQGSVRTDYGFDDEARWVRNYGVLETVFKYEEDEYGAYTARRRKRVSAKEKPGISPGIVRYTLPTTIFASLKDLGIALPEFREEFVTFAPTQAMETDLEALENFTWDELKDHWPHYTSAWLQWNLARPNSCFRAETVEGYCERELTLPPVVGEGERLPKEEWLVNTVKAELAAGRKVVVYVRQTGTRDIRSRLVQVLERAGVPGVQVLSESIAPRKREEWLRKNHVNVLITNPRLVATGLDLVQYSTVVFYEVEYSLYTLWQACRRVWRLGQVRPVKVFYLAYESTLEEKAYALIGQKIKAAQLLYGENVDSALVEDVGDASLVMALIKAIEEGEPLTLERGAHIFADTTEVVTESVVGSVVLPSTAVCDWQAWLAAKGLTMQDVRTGRRRKAASVPDGQLALW